MLKIFLNFQLICIQNEISSIRKNKRKKNDDKQQSAIKTWQKYEKFFTPLNCQGDVTEFF